MQGFSTDAQFYWEGVAYKILKLLPGEEANIEAKNTGATSVVKISTLVKAFFNEQVQFILEGKHVKKDSLQNIGIANKYINLSDCPETWVAIARYRLKVIQPLLNIHRRTMKEVENRVKEVKSCLPDDSHSMKDSVSVASIYRWIQDYEKSGNDLRSLIPNKRGGKGKSLSEKAETIINKVIEDKYFVREKVTVQDIHNELAVRITEENQLCSSGQHLPIPSESTVKRRIRELSPYKKEMAKRGNREAKRMFSQYEKTPYPSLPLERVEIDHTKSDLIVIDDRDSLPLGRLTLTYCLDMATRYPLGYYMGFEPPSYLAVMECLYHALCPKDGIQEKYGTEHNWLAYGVPSVLVVDNGKEFIGSDLQDACLLLGIVLQQTPVRTPYFKAGVERMYRSLNTMLFHTLPGTTFSDIKERGDYNSSCNACVYLSDVDKMLNIFIVDVYARKFHRGLNAVPAQHWEELTRQGFVPGLPPNAKELSILLGRTSHRTIHHYGIEFESLQYNCDELVALRTKLKGEKTKIKYHPADISCLYAYNPFENIYIKVPALDQQYTTGLSLWKHRIVRQTVLKEQDRVDIVALGYAKRKIQQIVDEGRRRKKQCTRSRIARWETSGKPIRQFIQESSSFNSEVRYVSTEIISKTTEVSPLEMPNSHIKDAKPEDDGWEISYSLQKYKKNIVKNNKLENLDE